MALSKLSNTTRKFIFYWWIAVICWLVVWSIVSCASWWSDQLTVWLFWTWIWLAMWWFWPLLYFAPDEKPWSYKKCQRITKKWRKK